MHYILVSIHQNRGIGTIILVSETLINVLNSLCDVPHDIFDS